MYQEELHRRQFIQRSHASSRAEVKAHKLLIRAFSRMSVHRGSCKIQPLRTQHIRHDCRNPLRVVIDTKRRDRDCAHAAQMNFIQNASQPGTWRTMSSLHAFVPLTGGWKTSVSRSACKLNGSRKQAHHTPARGCGEAAQFSTLCECRRVVSANPSPNAPASSLRNV